MTKIEDRLNTLLLRAHVLERVIHSGHPLSLRYGGLVVPAFREITEDSVVITGSFPAHCWIEPPSTVSLVIGHDVAVVASIPHPGDGPFEVRWTLSIGEVDPVLS